MICTCPKELIDMAAEQQERDGVQREPPHLGSCPMAPAHERAAHAALRLQQLLAAEGEL